jgi:phage gp37-like protein
VSTFRIDYVEASLIHLLQNSLPGPNAYGSPVDVDSLGDKDFDEDGILVFRPPAVRVLYTGSDYTPTADNKRLTYNASHPFDVLCSESSLRSKADMRRQTLVLVSAVLDQLSGARLALADNSTSMPVTILGVQLVVQPGGPVDQFYSISITVPGIAQFDGANS